MEAAGLVGWNGGPVENAMVVEGFTSILIGLNKQFSTSSAGIRITGIPRKDGRNGSLNKLVPLVITPILGIPLIQPEIRLVKSSGKG